jgi:pyruvate/2-oxoglutarate dehydrogenase complex dihydrolipoamide acyltransferase (E2) component
MGRMIVTFPDIGEGVVEGEVIEWLKKEGDSLKQDEPVVIVMTDKATVELPSPKPGVLVKCHVQAGQVAIKDKPLYEIETEGAVPSEQQQIPPATLKNPPKAPQQTKVSKKDSLKTKPEKHQGLAIPKVRHLAHQIGVPIAEITGSGKDGRVLEGDLFAKKEIENFPDIVEKPWTGIRKLMAQKMTESKNNIPHFSYYESADVGQLVQLRAKIASQAKGEGIHLTYMPFLIKALSLCINEFPVCNSSFDAKRSMLLEHRQHNIGIAISTAHGLIVPVLKDVQEMSIDKLIHSYDDLIQRASQNQLLPNEMKGGTISISNFGSKGHGEWATPVINYPEAAILAVGKIHKKVVAKNDEIAIKECINLSWSFDHRIIDGDMAVNISKKMCGLLTNPAALL